MIFIEWIVTLSQCSLLNFLYLQHIHAYYWLFNSANLLWIKEVNELLFNSFHGKIANVYRNTLKGFDCVFRSFTRKQNNLIEFENLIHAWFQQGNQKLTFTWILQSRSRQFVVYLSLVRIQDNYWTRTSRFV